MVHGPRAKIITCQSDDECHVSVNIDISADHFLHCLNSSLCIVDFDRIKRYIPKNITGSIQGDALDDNTIGIGLRNLPCSLRQVNTLGLKLLNWSCLPDKGKIIWQKPKRIVLFMNAFNINHLNNRDAAITDICMALYNFKVNLHVDDVHRLTCQK